MGSPVENGGKKGRELLCTLGDTRFSRTVLLLRLASAATRRLPEFSSAKPASGLLSLSVRGLRLSRLAEHFPGFGWAAGKGKKGSSSPRERVRSRRAASNRLAVLAGLRPTTTD